MFSNSPPSSPAATAPIDYKIVALFSLLLSAWLFAIDPVINRDAIIYLRTAEAFLNDGFSAAWRMFDRPLMSLCIATVHKFTGIPLVYSGLLLMAGFHALTAVGFVATIRLLGGDRRVQWLAAIIIISHPMINSSRSSIFRDPAFWAFSILAFRELLLYLRSPQLKHQLRWFLMVALSSLFRFEGLFFAVLAPLAFVAVDSQRGRFYHTIRLLAAPAASLAALAIGLALYAQLSGDSRLFPHVGRYIDQFARITESFAAMSTAMADSILVFTAKDDAPVAVIAALLGILLINLCRALTWPYLATLAWGLARGVSARIPSRQRVLINAHILIAILYLALFTLLNQFMLERYCKIFTLFTILYLPFIVDRMWGSKVGKYLAITLLVAMVGDSVHNGNHKKAFIRDANEWLVANAPPHSTLMSTDPYFAYFSGMDYDWRHYSAHDFSIADLGEQPQLWQGKDYLVAVIKVDEESSWQAFLTRYNLREAHIIDGGSRGKVSVVQPRVRLPLEPAP